MKEVDIVLNPQAKHHTFMKQSKEKSGSSASNRDCVTSLIIGLSIHPHVLSVEAELPITPDDYESHWISQSNRSYLEPALTCATHVVLWAVKG